MKRLPVCIAALAATTVTVSAQVDDSVWPQFRANNEKTAAVFDVPGAAMDLAWQRLDLPIPAPGGFSVSSNGDIYYKSNDDNGCWVFRLDPATGDTLAQSDNFNGNRGSYAGCLLTRSFVYTCVYRAEGDTSILKLRKDNLEIVDEFIDPAFLGLRGTPLMSPVRNQNNNYTLYVVDRNALQLHAVDATTGELYWSYDLPAVGFFGAVGPMWVEPGTGRPVIAHFGNADFFGGSAVADNLDGTFEELWIGGPENFNWWGSGALSEDQTRIYVTTFNDNDFPPLWAIDSTDGSVIWSVPGFRGDPDNELNFFARPAVVGDRVYCAGGYGVVTCFQDQGSEGVQKWEYRDGDDEFTVCSAAVTGGGDTYVYAVRQGLGLVPPRGELLVLRDDGDTFTEIYRTDLDGEMLVTLYANNSATVDAAGALYVGGGNAFATDLEDPGAVYKFAPPGGLPTLTAAGDCPGDLLLTVSGATSGRIVAFIRAFGTGSVPIPPGQPCAGTVLGLDRTATLIDTVRADANGVATLSGRAPAAACNRVYVQALDVDSCRTTNVVLIQ